MFDMLFQQWSKLVALPTPNILENSDEKLKINSTTDKNDYKQEIIDSIGESVDLLSGRCKSLQSANMALRILHNTVISKLPAVNTSLLLKMEEMMKELSDLEKINMKNTSFQPKHVITIEGLCATGKSTLIQQLQLRCPSIEYIDPRQISIHPVMQDILFTPFISANGTQATLADYVPYLPTIFHFLLNYFVAARAMNSQFEVVLIEEYYHAYCVQHVGETIASEDDLQSLSQSVFDWPYDLPSPELVLYLTMPTADRLKRQSKGLPSEGGDLAVKGSEGSASSINSRSHSRLIQRDRKAQAIYSMVRGPGTIGIDASHSIVQVASTAVEALDYYGVYSLSRAIVPVNAVLSSDGGENQQFFDSKDYSVNDDSDLLYGDHYLYSQPPVSADVISNRRVSIGIYEMFSRF